MRLSLSLKSDNLPSGCPLLGDRRVYRVEIADSAVKCQQPFDFRLLKVRLLKVSLLMRVNSFGRAHRMEEIRVNGLSVGRAREESSCEELRVEVSVEIGLCSCCQSDRDCRRVERPRTGVDAVTAVCAPAAALSRHSLALLFACFTFVPSWPTLLVSCRLPTSCPPGCAPSSHPLRQLT